MFYLSSTFFSQPEKVLVLSSSFLVFSLYSYLWTKIVISVSPFLEIGNRKASNTKSLIAVF